MSDTARLAPDLLERVLARLGFPCRPQPDLPGLCAVYAAWSARVPFDNVRKMIALLRPGAPLPGHDAADFLEAWLAHGASATCWPSSNALFALLHALGFGARRVAGSMFDTGAADHASVKVRIGDRDWLADSSMLAGTPIPLGDRPWASGDAVLPVECEPDAGTHVLWWRTPPSAAWKPMRLLVDPIDAERHRAAYEATRAASVFNDRLYAKRNHPGEIRLLHGRARHVQSAGGIAHQDLGPEALCAALRDEIGISGALIDEWRRAGGLERSFLPLPQEGPAATGPPRLPPSLRRA